MFLNFIDTQVLFRAVVYFVQPCSNSTRSVRAYALNSDLEHGRGLAHSRETAAVITIVANSATYDAQVARLTCFVDKQSKAIIRHEAAYEPELRKELVTSWEQA